MKKLIILNSIAIFIAVLLFLNIDDLLSYSWGWGAILFFLPITAGILAALVQNKDRSYKYLPRIIIGAFMFSFLVIFLGKAYVYFGENLNMPLLTFFNPFKDADEMVGHFGLAGIYIFGGLIGIVIRGVNLIFLPKYKFQLNLNISFVKSFALSSFIILGANIYYVMNSIPPDGRWKFQIPVTSLFIVLYLLVFFFISKKLIKNSQINYSMWAYSAVLSLVFISCATSIQVKFQYVDSLYLRYIAAAPYMIVFSLGIICYIFLVLYLQREENKRLN